MSSKKKLSVKLKKEYIPDLLETYPNAFEKIEKSVKVRNNINFYKKMIREKQYTEWIIKNLGMSYIGYLEILMQSLDYENRVKFDYLLEIGVKPGMANVAKKKFIDTGVIKKHKGDFYLNPMLGMKGESMNPEIMNLFANQ